MRTVCPYLIFPGTCREAVEFYRECFAGTIVQMQTVGESPLRVTGEHANRIFKAVTGETVAAFVRRSRLEHAAYLLKADQSRTITSAAMDAGFASSAEFSREFNQFRLEVGPTRRDELGQL